MYFPIESSTYDPNGDGVLNFEEIEFDLPVPVMPSFGTLHTLEKLIYWSAKEEVIYNVLSIRKVQIIEEIRLINTLVMIYGKQNSFRKYATTTKGGNMREMQDYYIKLIEKIWGNVEHLRQYLTGNYATKQEDIVGKSLEIGKYENNSWPNAADLYISQAAILLIQEYNGKTVNQLSSGVTKETSYGGQLNVLDFAQMSLHALSRNQYYFAVEWLKKAMKNTEPDYQQRFDFLGLDLLKVLWNTVVQMHNYQFMIKSGSTAIIDMYSEPISTNLKEPFPVSSRHDVTKLTSGKYGNDSYPHFNMLALCSGQEFQPIYIKSRLHCYLDKTTHPYFILIPLKSEQLSVYPFILQIYEIIGNDTMKMLYNSRGDLTFSPVVSSTDLSEILLARLAVGSDPNNEKAQEKLRVKAEMISGMKVDRRMKYSQGKLVEYIYGRHYSVHRDLISQRDPERMAVLGDPMATILYYMETPDSGGQTPFPSVGISATPVKGSVIFWLNMFRNGTSHKDVFHGSCPVAHGHKMILNQWIDYHDNFEKFKCSLDKHE